MKIDHVTLSRPVQTAYGALRGNLTPNAYGLEWDAERKLIKVDREAWPAPVWLSPSAWDTMTFGPPKKK